MDADSYVGVLTCASFSKETGGSARRLSQNITLIDVHTYFQSAFVIFFFALRKVRFNEDLIELIASSVQPDFPELLIFN